MSASLGKISYGIFFVAVVPVLIAIWGGKLDNTINGLPPAGNGAGGWFLIISGTVLILSAWWAFFRYGEGLPMNAYPPGRLVTQGIYSIIAHPIYLGFTAVTAGYFMVIGSGAGLWLVTPFVALGSLALVYGYERHDMKKRFNTAGWQTFFRFPGNEDTAPSPADRISAYVLVFLPWLLMYEAAIYAGPAPDSFESYLSFEHGLPVIEWTEAIYFLTYVFVLAAPLISQRKGDLRTFMIMGLAATIIGGFCFILFPLKATPRPFEVSGAMGRLLMFDRSMDGPAGSFPSFHVTWAFLAAWLFARSYNVKIIWYFIASMIALSCITTGMHSLADVSGGMVLFALLLQGRRLWNRALRTAEYIANSWREWRFGKIRIIVHGVYAGAGAFIGLFFAVHLVGARNMRDMLFIGFAALLGAGLWGQAIEGSSRLSRPFGYYGGLLGGAAGVLVSAAMGADGWLMAGAFSVAAPFIQATGRLRCLVQGCCHGRTCNAHQGIVFIHERSRVLNIAGLGNRPVYPTQLYSILYNVILGLLLIRAWTLSVPMPFIAGVYLILGSLGRFVEESYRGEPQTPVYAGLAIYQWLALAGVMCGAVLTTLEGKPYGTPVTIVPWVSMYAAIFGFITACAMGVDFPESRKRFSRLT